jgi:hypothetical protein
MTSKNPCSAATSFFSRGSIDDDEAIKDLCALPDFFIEELLSSDEASVCFDSADQSLSSTARLGAKRGHADDSAIPRTRGKK